MIIFQNPGLIDMRAVTTFGVSAKETDNAIGQFGTGLKYAIAVILREGGTINIYRGTTCYEFGVEDADIRGKTFGLVRMCWFGEQEDYNNVPMAYTTEYGKNWEPWQAFRELWSNCHDEKGTAWLVNNPPEYKDEAYLVENLSPGMTTITVAGMDKMWEERGNTILETQPMQTLAGVEVHPGESKHLYYQGIRVFDLDQPSKYTYNLTKKQPLSEDRKLFGATGAMRTIAEAIATCSWEGLIDDALTVGDKFLEGRLPWKDINHVTPSPAFVAVAAGVRDERRLAGSAKSLFDDFAKKFTSYGHSDPREASFSMVQKALLATAVTLVKASRFDLEGISFRMRSGWSNDTKCLLSSNEKDIIFNSSFFEKATHEDIAKQIIRALAMKAGGNREEQLTNWVLFGCFEKGEVDYDVKEDWHE